MSVNPLRIGAIGAGDISAYHLSGLAATGCADVRVVSSRRRERAAPVAKHYAIPDVVTDYRAVLERDDIDAIIITTPERSHEEIAVAAATAGKAILLQKPMADSIGACERIIASADNAGVNLQVSFMHRHFEETAYARELLRSGKLGTVFSARFRNATPGPEQAWYYDPEIAGGGVAWSLGVHGIDLVQHLLGPIATVNALDATMQTERTLPDGTRVTNISLTDHIIASYRLGNGALVSHEMSTSELSGTDRFRLEIYCEHGVLILRGARGPIAIHAPDITGEAGWHTPALPARAMGERHHAHWIDIVQGRAPNEATAWDAVAGLRVISAISKAAESGSSADVALTREADYAG